MLQALINIWAPPTRHFPAYPPMPAPVQGPIDKTSSAFNASLIEWELEAERLRVRVMKDKKRLDEVLTVISALEEADRILRLDETLTSIAADEDMWKESPQ